MLLPKTRTIFFAPATNSGPGPTHRNCCLLPFFWPPKKFEMKSRWWQLKCFFGNVHPEQLGFHDPIWRTRIFFIWVWRETTTCKWLSTNQVFWKTWAVQPPRAWLWPTNWMFPRRVACSQPPLGNEKRCFVSCDVDLPDGVLILLMVPKSGEHQLRLLVYPCLSHYLQWFYNVLYILGFAGFLPSTVWWRQWWQWLGSWNMPIETGVPKESWFLTRFLDLKKHTQFLDSSRWLEEIFPEWPKKVVFEVKVDDIPRISVKSTSNVFKNTGHSVVLDWILQKKKIVWSSQKPTASPDESQNHLAGGLTRLFEGIYGSVVGRNRDGKVLTPGKHLVCHNPKKM